MHVPLFQVLQSKTTNIFVKKTPSLPFYLCPFFLYIDDKTSIVAIYIFRLCFLSSHYNCFSLFSISNLSTMEFSCKYIWTLLPVFILLCFVSNNSLVEATNKDNMSYYSPSSVNVKQVYRTRFHFQPRRHWINGTSSFSIHIYYIQFVSKLSRPSSHGPRFQQRLYVADRWISPKVIANEKPSLINCLVCELAVQPRLRLLYIINTTRI